MSPSNRYAGSAALPREGEPGLGNAIERVYEAGQGLLVRRIDLLSEELATMTRGVASEALETIAFAVLALAGWFIAIAGVIGTLDDYFPRAGVQIAVGMLHLALGLGIGFHRIRRRPPAREPEAS